MSNFDKKAIENDLDILLGIKYCAKNIVDCCVDKSNMKYDEKCYTVPLNQNVITKSVNSMCFINNPQAPKKRIKQ
ncbi:MAG: hypothetical protein PUG48_06250 [Clostridia bacterium]|nr:hypothetical protein [Clostridia bacterium]